MVFALTNSALQVDQAVSAVRSGVFLNGSGVVYQSGDQSIAGNKNFTANSTFGNFSATGVSGSFLPAISGNPNIGSAAKTFAAGYFNNVIAANGSFATLTVGSLTANLNLSATGLTTISVTNTGYIQNLRVTGESFLNGAVSITGNINSSGENLWGGENTFVNTSFRGGAIFESTLVSTGTATFHAGLTSRAGATITGGAFSQSGAASLSGSLTHTGNFFQGGNVTITGNVGINGAQNITGSLNVVGGTTTVRAATLLTTGSSASDRLGIIQNVDITGDTNQTGSARISSNLNVTGNITSLGILNIENTGYFNGFNTSGNAYVNGSTLLTGTNSQQGNNFLVGNTRFTGSVTFANTTGDTVAFSSYYKNYVVASGLGTTSVASLSITNFFAATTSTVPAVGTGKWLTTYSGKVGEEGLFLTGASNTVANNNNLPLGTFGKAFKLINVGTWNGSGVWYPLGL